MPMPKGSREKVWGRLATKMPTTAKHAMDRIAVVFERMRNIAATNGVTK